MYLSVDGLWKEEFWGVVARDCSGQRCFIEIVFGDALRASMGQILPTAAL